MRLYEILSENEVLIKLRYALDKFTIEYNNLINILIPLEGIQTVSKGMHTISKKFYSSRLDVFEYDLNEFIND
jgi:hypothetical protein